MSSYSLIAGAALRRDLQQCHLRAPLGDRFEEPLERLDAQRDALGIIEAIDAEHEAAVAEALPHLSHDGRTFRVAGEPHIGRGLDPDREHAEPNLPPIEFEGAVARVRRALGHQIMGEVFTVVLRLETHEIIMRQASQDFPVMRQGLQNVRRGAGRVQEEADRILVAARPQFAAQQHQMVVMHPDDVVVPEQRAEPVREQLVDPEIAARLRMGIFLQIDPVVQDRPEHAVRQTIVIFLDVVPGKVDQNIGHLVDDHRSRFARSGFGDLPAPAEP